MKFYHQYLKELIEYIIYDDFFFYNNVNFKLKNTKFFIKLIKKIIKKENFLIENLCYIFCNDKYLLNINKKYLNKNYYTDIITFDYSENLYKIFGDIFISIERVRDNSNIYKVVFFYELVRVMIHGLLHLLGYNDLNENELNLMIYKENFYLNLFLI